MKYKSKVPFDKDELIAIQNTSFYTLLVTGRCNSKCWYCNVNFKKTRDITIKDMKNIIKFISFQNNPKNPNLVIHFFGGEPTLNKNIKIFSEMLKNKFPKRNLNILLTTNLLKSLEYFKTLPKYITFVASYHSDHIPNTDKWIEKARYLKDSNQLYSIDFMLQKRNSDFILELYKKYRKEFPCIILPITQILRTDSYLKIKQKLIDEINENPFEDTETEVFADYENKGKLHMCSAGLIIDEYGNVFYCWKKRNNKNLIINIFEKPETQVGKWHPCETYDGYCDMEVPRSSVRYYLNNIKPFLTSPKNGKEYTDCELEKYKPREKLYRCNA
jgi:MoaA/NifB/PqqE/SkfB family radical SAM enzyme